MFLQDFDILTNFNHKIILFKKIVQFNNKNSGNAQMTL